MKLVVCSAEDAASVNITDRMVELGGWEERGGFEGRPVKWKGDAALVTIPTHHLWYDAIDDKVERALGQRPSLVVFASRHKSASNMRTLTVHPIGNYGKAGMGGRDGTLVPAAPPQMTRALRLLGARAKEASLQYLVSLEATHHGPYLSTPTFYIEIGSDEAAWKEPGPTRAIAETIEEVLKEEAPLQRIALGVGGGHYVPRMTDVALEKNVHFGHMMPSYVIEEGWRPVMLEEMLRATPGAELVYFHKKAIKTPVLREMMGWFKERGIETVSSKDLD